MNSRDHILTAIKAGKPELTDLPDIPLFQNKANAVDGFVEMLGFVGGTVTRAKTLAEVNDHLKLMQQKSPRLVNAIPELYGHNINAYKKGNASELEAVDTVFIKGRLGVAENGAVWINESDMVNRLFPFICRRLVLVIDAKDIVSNMHEAYARIAIDEDGYGVFIAGPSKTADIEQSLVIGAHGPLSLQVFIIS
jgi:L-lactate dehydrogenase complex protein LldG